MKRDMSIKSGNVTVELTDHLSNYIFVITETKGSDCHNKNNWPLIRVIIIQIKFNFI